MAQGIGLDGDKTTDKGVRGDEDGSQSGLHSDASGRLGSRQSGSSTLDSRPGSSMKKFGVRGSARNRKKNFGVEVHVHANCGLIGANFLF